ncbi:MAG: CTP synthase, partial [Sulfuriferula sp.]
IVPDCVIVRSDSPAPENVARKISQFSGVAEEGVILLANAPTVFQVPLLIANSGINDVMTKFTGNDKKPDLTKWEKIVAAQSADHDKTVNVGLVAKYMDNEDTYISVLEALKAAAWQEDVGLDIKWINAETANKEDFDAVDALLVPGGFGERGIPGKIAAADYALTTGKPYLGLCLGLQVAVIAAARRAGLTDAHSTEFDPETVHNVVYIMEGQQGKESTGGTLRLGNYDAKLTPGSKVAAAYGATEVVERHRHRYEVNQAFTEDIQKGGLVISGTSPDGKLVEFVESANDSYFVATQAHPELKSRPNRAHPLFVGLIRAAK